MQTKLFSVLGVALALCACSSTPQSVLERSQAAMGKVTSLRYSGKGINGDYGQALLAGQEWPRRDLNSYSRSINYDQKSSSEVIEFAQPVFGGQKQNPVVNGDKAWNVADTGSAPQPPAAAEGRQLRIWMTPHGFLKAAAGATGVTPAPGQNGTQMLSVTVMGKYKLTGTIDGAGMVTRVETVVPDAVLGETPLSATYSEYADHGGVKFPGHIVEEQGGFMILDINVDNVQPGAAVDLPVPPAVQSAPIAPMTVTSTKLANGVWHLTGGSHHSLVVEFPDFIAVVEGPQSEERGKAVIAEAHTLVPTKPIKYVVTTHHHFDHISGLRPFVAEGATIVTDESNVAYLTKAFSGGSKAPMFEGVKDKYVITDGAQRMEVYSTVGDTHTNELLVAYLPGSRILMEADSYNPNDPNAKPTPPPANAVTLYDNIERLKLNVSQIAPVHGRGAVPIAEFRRFVGR